MAGNFPGFYRVFVSVLKLPATGRQSAPPSAAGSMSDIRDHERQLTFWSDNHRRSKGLMDAA
jgi:hypothetical protein